MWHHPPYLFALYVRIWQEEFIREAEAERLYQQAKSAQPGRRISCQRFRKLPQNWRRKEQKEQACKLAQNSP